MTIRPLHLCLAALTFACGPGDATTTTTTDDGTDTTAQTDDTSSSVAADGSSSSSGAGDDTFVDTSSAGDDTTSSASSSESGGDAAREGRFALTALGATIEPVGCAAEHGAEPGAWTIDFTLPADDGPFSMLERFGPHATQFDCTLANVTFTCAHVTTVDYAFASQDAIVGLAATYEVGWEGDGLAGMYNAEFTCEGDDCASVVDEWQLTAFPCGVQVPFTGALGPR